MIFARFNFVFVLFLMLNVFIISGCSGDGEENTVDMFKFRAMGLAYLEENKLNEAEAAFKKLIEIAPREALGYANLGLVYIRLGNFEAAEKQFMLAMDLAPEDPEIHLNYAEVLSLTDREQQANEILEESLKNNPDHIRTLYTLGKSYAQSTEKKSRLRAERFLKKVVGFLPANITARLELIELLLKKEKADSAAGYYEQLRAQMPEFPDGADMYYQQALSSMYADNTQNALTSINIFRNILKPAPVFQAGVDELKGMSGPLIGIPVITFRKDLNLTTKPQQVILESIKFTDATEAAGLNVLQETESDSAIMNTSSYKLAVADFDGNGTQDLYAALWNQHTNNNKRFLLSNNFGSFIDITSETGISHSGQDRDAIFADYDNDGYLDLFLVNSTRNILYHHFAPQKLRNVAAEAGLADNDRGNAASFADFDHDGDLDLFLASHSENAFYRNNLDGSFRENARKMALAGADNSSIDIAFSDFDDDGDLDLFVLNAQSSNVMYSNLRQGQFSDVTSEWGLNEEAGSTSLATADYNNDGLTDILITHSGRRGYTLFSNKNGTRYEKDTRSAEMEAVLKDYICSDVHFFDFDNDGFLDVIFAGKFKQENKKKSAILLFHNDGKGVFKNVSNLLPDIPSNGVQMAIADYNEDGDQDIFFSAEYGKVYLLRNDGGNANHYLKVQLVGLRTGSGKNNYFGIGAKVEVKAGELYQSRIVTDPVSHFGLGQKTKADIVRVLWTNGVPQNLFEPGTNQALLEKQILKGSCPFLYAWNGEKYEFITDVLWRSALGMPLGIMGGETAYAFSDPSQDYFRIPGEMLKEKNGFYSLKLTSELWETAYFDQVKLMVIDHPDTTDIYVDERFTPLPFPPLHFYHVSQKKFPVSITDENGNDLISETRQKDNVYVDNLSPQRYQGVTKIHDLIIDLGDSSKEQQVTLFLNGWVFPTDASINVAMAQSSENLVQHPMLQVKNKKGQWQTVINNLGFPMGKNKFVVVDLKDKFLSGNRMVRIRTTMQIYWDYIFYTVGDQKSEIRKNTLLPESADIHYRGFSRMYRKGGRKGPFWFDYNDVSKGPKWRDLEGYYTRYGDVTELLQYTDSKYIITNAGDEISLEFDAGNVPQLPKGWTRDFVIYTNGWLKDGDLNTAHGQRVEPLPFRGMTQYPYGPDEFYPTDKEYQEFLNTYITRKVTKKNFNRWLLDNY